MRNEELRQKLNNYFTERGVTAKLFDTPDFDNSIIGISSDNRVVYSLDSMIQEFMKDNDCSWDAALEFIEYNTLRVLDYQINPPIIIETLDKITEK